MSLRSSSPVQIPLVTLALIAYAALAQAGEIRLVGGTIDTGAAPQAPSGAKSLTSGSLLLVQFDGPIQPDWRRAALALGVELHHYIPDQAYLATVPPEALDALKKLDGVAWVGELPPALKVRPALQAKRSAKAPTGLTVLSIGDAAARQLQRFKNAEQRKAHAGWTETRMQADPSAIDALAAIPGVFFVEEQPVFELHGERGAQTAAGNYDPGDTAPNGPGFTSWLASHGLTGAPDVIVQVQDDGLDRGDTTNNPGTAHPDILGRIAGIDNPTSDPLGNSTGGHGQINAGIIMGNATVGTQDLDGYAFGQGLAPQARVFATKIFRNAGSFDTGGQSFSQLAKTAQDAGVTYSNNSWGGSVSGAYTAESAEFDALTRDADPTEPGDQPIVYFFSSGNSGPSNQTIGTPGTAKNVIAVGATENSDGQTYTNPLDNTDRSGVGPTGSDNFRELASFSSRGPTQDGRLGVTVVATGTHVSGPASTDPGYTGNTVSDKYWPAGQTDYARSSGTSHSCPTAAGAGLLVQEFFATQLAPLGHTATPSPAMVRAVLTNTATDMGGNSNGGSGTIGPAPSPEQGWGTVNLSTLFDMKESLYTLDQAEVFTASGQSWSQVISVSDPSKPLRISLAWTDAPATPSAAVTLVNDLDLVVTQDAVTWRGNNFVNGNTQPGGDPDRRETLEAVYIENPSGRYTVTVDAYNIAGDGLPNDGGGLDQDFVLFVWNGTDQSPLGYVRLDRTAYRCMDTLEATLSDSDLRGAGSASVTLSSSSGDTETLALAETGPDTGVLVGSMPIDEGGPAADGALQVAPGDTITATYNDADDGDGQPAIATAEAAVDCTAPAISNVAALDLQSTAVTISFDTDESATAVIRYGLAADALDEEWPLTGAATEHSVTVRGLEPLTTYYFTVEATDLAGNTSVDDNGGTGYTFTTLERPDYYTEVFDTGDFDLAHKTLTWSPNGSSSYYALVASESSGFAVEPTSGTEVSLGDDDFLVFQFDGAAFPFYGQDYTRVYIGSNGYLTFTEGDVRNTISPPQHFALPRIGALFADVDPSSGGTVYAEQRGDRVVVTFDSVPQWGTTNSNSFQFELFFSGVIRITYLGMGIANGVAGLSQGEGLPVDYVESDLSTFEIIDDLEVDPVEPFLPVGYQGGPFGPSSKRYILTNTGSSALGWTLAFEAEWIEANAVSGTLNAGASTEVQVVVAAAADSLDIATYTDVLAFTNEKSGVTRERNAVLQVLPPPPIIRVDQPQPLEAHLYIGETRTFDPAFTIFNDGVDTLDYAIRIENIAEPDAPQRLTPSQAVASIIGRSGILEGALYASGELTLLERLARSKPLDFAVTNPDAVARLLERTEPVPATESGFDVAVLGADYSSALLDIQEKLFNTNRFAGVTTINVALVTPTLEELLAFDAVTIYGNDVYANATALGDVMADYADNGGGVVSMVFEIGGEYTSPGTIMGGRWTTDGYPLLDRSDFLWLTTEALGDVLEPDHPIMAGVESFGGGFLSVRPAATGVFEGARIIAEWTDGSPLVVVGERNGSVRAALGFFPVSSDEFGGLSRPVPDFWDSSTDGDLLMANALQFVAEASVPWLEIERPMSGSVEGGGEPDARYVTFDATDLEAGTYSADLVILSDDPEMPEYVIPATLNVATDDMTVVPAAAFEPHGLTGGPFAPATKTYTITNEGEGAINWIAETEAPWLEIAPPNGGLQPGESAQVELSLSAAAASLPHGQHAAAVVFTNLTTRSVLQRQALLTVEQSVAAAQSLDTDPGWVAEGEWEYGAPLGQGGIENGNPDPSTAYTGGAVYGVNLEGDYEAMPGGPWHLTAGPFDLTYYANTTLHFARWLNTDHPLYVTATVEVSNDKQNWDLVWESPGVMTDAMWRTFAYDISPVADGQQEVYVRWGYEIGGDLFGDDMAFAYSGWNIDDIELRGDLDQTDSDGDGVPDYLEDKMGTDPNDANDFPAIPAPLLGVLGALLTAAAWRRSTLTKVLRE